jgi:hypothetical protein
LLKFLSCANLPIFRFENFTKIIGDAAYVETMEIYYFHFTFPGPEQARERLNNAKNDPAYVKLRSKTPIVGVWDNHDFGQDGGKSYKI